MIGQMNLLLRVKDLKRDQALRELQRKRALVAEAEVERLAAQDAVAESQRTFAAREDAIFAGILGQVVEIAAIDLTHGRVARLREDHTVLEDVRERALHVEARLRGEMEAAGTHYRAAEKVCDKYGIIATELRTARDAEIEYREESDVEEMFTRPRKRIA